MSLKLLAVSLTSIAILLRCAWFCYQISIDVFGLFCCFFGILYITLTPFVVVLIPVHPVEVHPIQVHDHDQVHTDGNIYSNGSHNSSPEPSPMSTPCPPERTLPRRSPRFSRPPVRFIDEFAHYYRPKVWVQASQQRFKCHYRSKSARIPQPFGKSYVRAPPAPFA
jgi:hypothetical protein